MSTEADLATLQTEMYYRITSAGECSRSPGAVRAPPGAESDLHLRLLARRSPRFEPRFTQRPLPAQAHQPARIAESDPRSLRTGARRGGGVRESRRRAAIAGAAGKMGRPNPRSFQACTARNLARGFLIRLPTLQPARRRRCRRVSQFHTRPSPLRGA
jgi:hypothetical protein